MSESDLTEKPGWKAVERWLKESERPAVAPISRRRRLLNALALMVVYPLFIGPASKLVLYAGLECNLGLVIAILYLPLLLLAHFCPPVGRALAWYMHFWVQGWDLG